MARSFRDRFFTPRVANAIMSPLGILLAGAGAAVGIVVGLPVALAAGVGVAAWAGRVALAIPRQPRGEAIDPFALGEPWRGYVQGALDAQRRFERAVGSTRAGPLHDRLAEIGDRIATGVRECWRVASRAQDIHDAIGALDTAQARRELSALERDADATWAKGSHVERTAQSLRAQIESAERMADVVTDARDRLRLLDARLDEAVARAVELSVGTGDDVGTLVDDVDGVVAEMEILRQALEETAAS